MTREGDVMGWVFAGYLMGFISGVCWCAALLNKNKAKRGRSLRKADA
jgi:hypothetical protein